MSNHLSQETRNIAETNPDNAVWRTIFSLGFATALCGLLWCARLYVSRHWYAGYLIWNLFLAWIPLFLAVATKHSFNRNGWSFRLMGIGLLWLLFLPNASYIVTDFVHLREQAPVPLWFDSVLFAAFAFTGVALGFVALRVMHDCVRERRGVFHGWLFVLGILALCGLGIYLGRIERWNSWSVLTEPHNLWADVRNILSSWANIRLTIRFSGVFFVFLTLCYFIFSGITAWPMSAPATQRKNLD